MSINKITPAEKLQTVHLILEGKETQRHARARLGVSLDALQQWIRIYKSEGEGAFLVTGYKKYSKELKEQAVMDYLSGRGSLQEICQRYGIRAKSKLQNWIKKYNGHEELKASGTGGTAIMTKGRKTTFNERVEIVQYCIAHDHNYAETAAKFDVSYQQARSYTVKYEAGGVDALQDRRGRSKPVEEMSELERLRAENKILRAEKERAEMEVSFLKKLDELERRRG
jgi:transposase-like protein